METTFLTCIMCPIGCSLKVEHEGAEVFSITGNTCPRGKVYGTNEVSNPMRVVTSSVLVEGSSDGSVTVSCKTAGDIPKGKIKDAALALKGVKVKAPVHIGDVLLKNVAGTGVDIIATKNVE
ncbi:MAG: DUF1667 domain-containing protein [Firmicutes bacterium]|nr:DUF1667 domain-containing protein [Bacillota bacterium]